MLYIRQAASDKVYKGPHPLNGAIACMPDPMNKS